MIQVKCKFTGARPLKSGLLTGMLEFEKDADRHALIDLEGDAYLVKQVDIPNESKEAVVREIRVQLEKIIKLLEDDKDTVEQETVLFEGE